MTASIVMMRAVVLCKKVFNKRVKCGGSVKSLLISSFSCDKICTQRKSILNLQCNH